MTDSAASPERQPFDRNWLVVAVLGTFAWMPLLYPGFFQSSSGVATLYRAVLPDANLYFPPIPGDVAPLAYALPRLLTAAGLDALAAVRLAYGLALAGAGLTMYLAARRLLGATPGLIAALVYAYLPYLLALTYARGAISEAVFAAVLPLALWAVAAPEPARGLPWPRLALIAIAGLLAVLAHPGLGLASLFVLIAFAIACAGRRAAGLAALSLVPAAVAALLQLWPPAAAPAAVRGVDPHRWFSPDWHAGPGEPSFQLGLAAVLLALLAAAALWPDAEDAPADGSGVGRVTVVALVATVVLLALTTVPAATLWTRLGLQFLLAQPWQLNILAGLCLSVAAGCAVAGRRWGPMLRDPAVHSVVVVAVVLASYGYLLPRTIPAAALPDPTTPPLARFSGGLVLAGCRVDQAPGERVLRVTLLWQSVSPVGADYTVFAHLLDGQGQLRGQKDSPPAGGTRPTTGWAPGEYLADAVEVELAPDAAPGAHTLEIGLYVLATGQRDTIAVPVSTTAIPETAVRVPVTVR